MFLGPSLKKKACRREYKREKSRHHSRRRWTDRIKEYFSKWAYKNEGVKAKDNEDSKTGGRINNGNFKKNNVFHALVFF